MRGWLGGACAEPTVVREARRALEEGTPRLLFLGPPEELAGHERDGVVTVPIACQSEGAMEVHVEPVLPQPQLVAIGRSPAAIALTAMAGRAGMAERRRRRRRRSRRPSRGGSRSLTTLDLAPRRGRTVVRRRRDAGPLRRGRARAGARDAGRVHRPRRLPQACRSGARAISGIAASREEALARVHAPAGPRPRHGSTRRRSRSRSSRRSSSCKPASELRPAVADDAGSPRATRRSTPCAG